MCVCQEQFIFLSISLPFWEMALWSVMYAKMTEVAVDWERHALIYSRLCHSNFRNQTELTLRIFLTSCVQTFEIHKQKTFSAWAFMANHYKRIVYFYQTSDNEMKLICSIRLYVESTAFALYLPSKLFICGNCYVMQSKSSYCASVSDILVRKIWGNSWIWISIFSDIIKMLWKKNGKGDDYMKSLTVCLPVIMSVK